MSISIKQKASALTSELQQRNERNALFNDAVNTSYLRYYGGGHMVKNRADGKRGKPAVDISRTTISD